MADDIRKQILREHGYALDGLDAATVRGVTAGAQSRDLGARSRDALAAALDYIVPNYLKRPSQAEWDAYNKDFAAASRAGYLLQCKDRALSDRT